MCAACSFGYNEKLCCKFSPQPMKNHLGTFNCFDLVLLGALTALNTHEKKKYVPRTLKPIFSVGAKIQ